MTSISKIRIISHGSQASAIDVSVSATGAPSAAQQQFEQAHFKKFIAERTPALGYATAEQKSANRLAATEYAKSLQQQFGGEIKNLEF